MEFYSSWLYSAARLNYFTWYSKFKILVISLIFPLNLVNSIVNFLIEKNLCIIKDKKLTFGPFRTHIEKFSVQW